MNADQIVTVVVGIAQSGAAGLIVWALIRSLKIRIDGLQKTITVQNDTIDAMEKRVGEAEKIGDLYKGLVKDLPALLESLSKGKDQIIRDLQASLEHKERSAPSIDAITQRKEDKTILLTMRFMLSGENNELSKMAQNLTGNIDSAAILLSRAKDFDEFVRSAGGRLHFEDNQDKFKEMIQFKDKQGNITGIRNASFNMGGFYGIFEDKKVIISSAKYSDFKVLFEKLRMELNTLV